MLADGIHHDVSFDAYLSGKCKPDPVKAWIALGRPAAVDAAFAAMRA